MTADNSTWALYCGARYLALGLPLHELEQQAERRAAAALRHCLALGPDTAAYYARRCSLFQRDVLLHEALALDLAPDRVADILDSVAGIGLTNLLDVDARRGILFASIHYSLYSSLLVWWLARAAAQELVKHLTILVRSNLIGQYLLSEYRLQEFEQAGISCRERVTVLDGARVGPSVAARCLLRRLRTGGAVFVLADASLAPATGRLLRVAVGRQTLGLARGIAWLGAASRCAIVPVYIRPHAESRYAVTFCKPSYFGSNKNAAAMVESALQDLINQTVLADPSPWQGWLRERLIQLIPTEKAG